MHPLPAWLAAMVVLLGGCGTAQPVQDTSPTRPAGLAVSVGGSVGVAGAVVSSSR